MFLHSFSIFFMPILDTPSLLANNSQLISCKSFSLSVATESLSRHMREGIENMILQTQASTLAALLFIDSRSNRTGVLMKCDKDPTRNIIADYVPQHTPDIPSRDTVSNDRTRTKTTCQELN